MKTQLAVLAALLALPALPALAQTVASAECPGAQIHGDGEVPVQIQARSIKAAASARCVAPATDPVAITTTVDSR